VTRDVSAVAANSAVRAELVERQREWARVRGGGVLEGRDIGTVVFPDAALKVYLTASPTVRAARRHAEAGGDLAQIAEAIDARDRKDRERVDGPLKAADEAVEVDTSDRAVDEIVDEIVGHLVERGRMPG
jgi:cytidylate kinase